MSRWSWTCLIGTGARTAYSSIYLLPFLCSHTQTPTHTHKHTNTHTHTLSLSLCVFLFTPFFYLFPHIFFIKCGRAPCFIQHHSILDLLSCLPLWISFHRNITLNFFRTLIDLLPSFKWIFSSFSRDDYMGSCSLEMSLISSQPQEFTLKLVVYIYIWTSLIYIYILFGRSCVP